MELPEGVLAADITTQGAKHGKNEFGRSGYGGLCPPSGSHRCFFKLYALDSGLGLKAGAGKSGLLQAMEGRILAQGQLIERYSLDNSSLLMSSERKQNVGRVSFRSHR